MDSQSDLHHKVKKLDSFKIEYKDLNILSLSQVFIFELSLNRLNAGGILIFIKKYSLDSYLKAILGFSFRRNRNFRNVQYLMVNDIFNKSMITNMNSVKNCFDMPYAEIVADKRLLNKDNIFLFSFFNPFNVFKQITNSLKVIRNNSITINQVCAEFNINKILLILNIIESVFIINCVQEFYKKHRKIKRVLLNTDAHKISRTFTLLAERRNIRTYVMQHGSTVLEYGYLPLKAGTMFAWGELSKAWFIERGADSKKLVVTGTPKTDFIANLNINKETPDSITNILVIMNPVGNDNVEKFLQIIFKSQIHLNYNLIIKLHPSSADNRILVEKYFKTSNTKIYKFKNTHKLILESDVVITTTSTVGNEAIALYKPLVQIEIQGLDTVMEYELFNCSHKILNSIELCDLLLNINQLNSKKNNYEIFLENYFFRIDGKSRDRIKDNLIKGL